jgi:hypothetical protein
MRDAIIDKLHNGVVVSARFGSGANAEEIVWTRTGEVRLNVSPFVRDSQDHMRIGVEGEWRDYVVDDDYIGNGVFAAGGDVMEILEIDGQPRPITSDHDICNYIHCQACLSEISEFEGDPAYAEIAARHSRLDIGYTHQGIQVWCRRHNCNVVNLDFQGFRPKANTTTRIGVLAT